MHFKGGSFLHVDAQSQLGQETVDEQRHSYLFVFHLFKWEFSEIFLCWENSVSDKDSRSYYNLVKKLESKKKPFPQHLIHHILVFHRSRFFYPTLQKCDN